jgi:uncharacterized membrane protein YebE (DUF533 family)
MIKKQLNILINMAIIDRDLDEAETERIYQIGLANGLGKDEVREMIERPQPIDDLSTLTEDEKFEYLYAVVQLMKTDGKIFKSEIVYCQQLAEKLGYKRGVVAELSSKIYSDPTITADRDMLKQKAHQFYQG